MVRVKICGITRSEDLQVAVASGAHAVGFVFEPSSPRYVGDRLDLLDMLRSIPPFVVRVAVFGQLRELPEAVWQSVDAIQFIPAGERPSLPLRLRRILTVRLRSEEDIPRALILQGEADALLVDAYHPDKPGGTGEQADWRLARLLREQAQKPIILAGGLNPDNVQEAIRQVMPHAVDVSSGVESAPGKKDHHKIKEFIANVRRFANGS
ncbi:N-(5'-phosphoribosyl)anthranilate isomerase [bacterium HR16]|nr:N-(5'-phosphoribosyl)anthranilate isomerase [bacterium HR16]